MKKSFLFVVFVLIFGLSSVFAFESQNSIEVISSKVITKEVPIYWNFVGEIVLEQPLESIIMELQVNPYNYRQWSSFVKSNFCMHISNSNNELYVCFARYKYKDSFLGYYSLIRSIDKNLLLIEDNTKEETVIREDYIKKEIKIKFKIKKLIMNKNFYDQSPYKRDTVELSAIYSDSSSKICVTYLYKETEKKSRKYIFDSVSCSYFLGHKSKGSCNILNK